MALSQRKFNICFCSFNGRHSFFFLRNQWDAAINFHDLQLIRLPSINKAFLPSHLMITFLQLFFILWGGTKYLGTVATSGLLYKPQIIDEGDCGASGGMKIGRGNRSTRRKPAPAPLCPPQIPHDQIQAQTRAAAVGSQQLIAWAMVRPFLQLTMWSYPVLWQLDLSPTKMHLTLFNMN
jgi:hypothetical protein